MAGMVRPPVSRVVQDVIAGLGPMVEFFARRMPELVERFGDDLCDFLAGNPQEGAIEGYAEALHRWADPRRRDWFAYKTSEPRAQEVVAASLREYLGVPFRPEDIALTNASISALAATLRTVCDPGDEVITICPPHFLYRALVVGVGATAVPVNIDWSTLDLDLVAIEAAITPRTRAIIVNSPHNPTGKIFPPDTLRELARLLTEASDRHQPIYLLSDEAYNRILFDDRAFISPMAFYPRSFLIYSYGKVLLAPAQRIGYIAMHPDLPDLDELRGAMITSQVITGYAFPNALLQHALPDLDPLRVDVKRLQARRDLLVDALQGMGYELHVPEATFYLLPHSPVPDDDLFCEWLAEDGVVAMPGSFLEVPGRFRLSLTASDDMVERSLPVFARAIERARAS
jgi:aspartate aminotransferase